MMLCPNINVLKINQIYSSHNRELVALEDSSSLDPYGSKVSLTLTAVLNVPGVAVCDCPPNHIREIYLPNIQLGYI